MTHHTVEFTVRLGTSSWTDADTLTDDDLQELGEWFIGHMYDLIPRSYGDPTVEFVSAVAVVPTGDDRSAQSDKTTYRPSGDDA